MGSRAQPRLRRVVVTGLAACLCVTAPGACGADTATTDGLPPAAPPHATAGHQADSGAPLPSAHVHGVGRDPGDGRVYLATHDGLFRLDRGKPPARVGPVIDLMGFAVAGPHHFYASGHPAPSADLPDPVGLIESTDGGRTWTPLSRQGRSDFHTLSWSRAGILGFDGRELAVTTDGRAWTALSPPVAPHAVAASPDGATILATSESGLIRSTDRGAGWQQVSAPTVLQLVAWADARTVLGVAPDGAVASSTDAGKTWQLRGSLGGRPQAVSASVTNEGVELIAVTETGLLRSLDRGASFTPFSG